MPIKMMVGGIEVTVDSPAEAAALLQSMNAVPPTVEEQSPPVPVVPAAAPAPEPERVVEVRYELPKASSPPLKKRVVRRLSYERANIARRMFKDGKSIREIAKVVDVNEDVIERCLAGETWNENTIEYYKNKGELNQHLRQEKLAQGKPMEPVKLPPLPPAPAPTAEDEVVELLLMGENPAEVAKAYKIDPWTLIGIWNLKFDRAKRNEDKNTASSMSKMDAQIQLWGAQQKTSGFRPR